MMKNVFFLLAMFTCLFASCSGGGNDEPVTPPTPKPEVNNPTITLDSSIQASGLSFDTSVAEKSITFTTTSDWTLSIAETRSGTTWCTASPTSGGKGTATIKFTTTENTEPEDRSVAVTIKAGTANKTFTITQKGADALLVTTTKYEVAQEGGQIEVEVKANIDYLFAISETAKDWITETKSKSRGLTSYKHTFDIAMNENSEKREGEITFKSGDKVETVKVYQAGGAIILLTQAEYTVSDAGETISVEIKSNVEFGVQMPNVDWINDEASSRGMSSHTLKYNIAVNEGYDSRSAEIIFYDKNSDLKDTLKVVQVQKDAIVISQKTYEVKAEGEIIDVKFSANVDFEVTMPEVDWVWETESRTLTDYTIKFGIAENKDEQSRKTEIIFTNKDSGIEERLIIMQECAKPKVELSIHVETAGTLSSLIDEKQKYVINSLKVTGCLNGDDIRFLREMAGIDYDGKKTEGKLHYLDMVQCSIVKGGRYYKNAIETKDNIIGKDFFRSCSQIEHIKLPSNVVLIEDNAFAHCVNLNSINLSATVTEIGTNVFYSCQNLTSINIPENMTKIGEGAFSYCENLTSINLPDNVVEIGAVAFRNTKIQSIDLPEGISVIRLGTFHSCKELKDVCLPSSIKTISELAFYGCSSLSEISFPNGLEEIARSAFSKTNVSDIVLPSTLVRLDGFSECQYITKIVVPNTVKRIGESAFNKCENLTSVSLPEGLKTLYGFDKCISLTNIEIPNSVDTLSAFSGCVNLQTIKIPENVTYLGGFSGCSSLKEINIPKSVKTIGNNAFDDCVNLTSVNIPENVTEIGGAAFYGCKNIKSFELPESLKVIGSMAFYECRPTYLNLPNSLERIDDSAFWGFGSWGTKKFSFNCQLEAVESSCFENSRGLESVVFTDKTKIIKDRAFYICQTLKKVTFSDEIVEIGEYAFSCCSALDTISPIPGKIGYVSNNAFNNTSIKTAVLSEGIHSIMPSAFENCSELIKLNLPKTLSFIYGKAFAGCTKLTEIHCGAITPPVISDSTVLENIDKTKCKLYVPKDCAKAYKSDKYWKDFTNIIELE